MRDEHEKQLPEEKENSKSTAKEDIYSTEEVNIEEMAIDGICGVY